LTPMQAILSVTKWPAEAYHKEKDIGTVEPGKLADLIAINGDPLTDIKNTRNVEVVIVGGKEVNITLDPHFRYSVLPEITLSQSSLQFEARKIDAASAPQTITLTNSGTGTLNVNHIETSKGVTQTNDCRFEGLNPTGLPPGQTCKIAVTFTPSATGPQTGKLVIFGASADLYSPSHVITVTGSGLQ
jgi:adenine deaminase